MGDLRGRHVLIDFWTSCCVNCLHVLDELRPVEQRFADELVVVGVHSPKFEHERDPDAVVAAVERYGVHHPVLDDPDLVTWQAYAARAWPTLVLVDPEGYVVAQMSGEGHAHGLSVLLEELVAEHDANGTLHRGAGPYVAPPPPETSLRFPGKVAALPDGGWLVSDTAHHQLVELEDDLVTERRRIGSGATGLVDGLPEDARFDEPQGVHVLPRRSVSTSSWPTASTTWSAASGSRTARSRRWPARASSCASGPRRPSRASRPDARPARLAAHGRPGGGQHRGGPAGRTGTGRLAGAAVRPRGRRGRRLGRRRGDLVAATPAPRGRFRGPTTRDARRRRAVRVRARRRCRRPGAVPAPARRRAAPRRQRRGGRHLQRRGPAVRPGHRRGRHPGRRAGGAVRPGPGPVRARAAARRGGVGRAPAGAGPAAARGPARARRRPAHHPAADLRGTRRPGAAGRLRPPSGQKLDDRWGTRRRSRSRRARPAG